MAAHYELLLILGVLAFYLQDSMMLLHYDELVFTEARRKWRVSTGSTMQFGGRHLFLPNPVTPARGLFRGCWSTDHAAAPPEHWPGLRHFIAALSPLKVTCRVLWSLLLVALPLLLLAYPHPMALLALLVLVYGCVAALAWQMWRRRNVLELDNRAFASLAFEGLTCPPFAINTVRKICLRRGVHGDLVGAAGRTLDRAGTVRFRELLSARIAMASVFEDASGPRGATLATLSLRIEQELP